MKQQNIIRACGIFIKWRSAAESAEIAAGAGLVGADLGAGAGGAAEAGGLEPDVDMQGGVGQLLGKFEDALGAVGTHGAGVEFGRLCIRQVDGHIEAVVGHGIHVAKSGIRTGDA